jgi:YD repeat-containing protein
VDLRPCEFEYDAEGRLIEEVWFALDGSTVVETFQFTYTAGGLLETAGNSVGTYTFTYNSLGQVIEVEQPFGVTQWFSYDRAGNRILVEDSFGGRVESEYDEYGRLISRVYTQNGAPTLRIDQEYDDEGRLIGQTRTSDAAGTNVVATSSYSYNLEGRLTSLLHQDDASATIAEYLWEYDLAGQLISQSDHGDTREYTTIRGSSPATARTRTATMRTATAT